MKKKSLFIAAASILFLFSCQKEETIIGEKKDSNYFIDDVAVSEVEFKNQLSDLYVVEVHGSSTDLKSKSTEGMVEKRAFTTQERYIKCGEQYGLSFDKQLIFEQIMKDYAENSGAIAEFENTGEMPDWYLAREKFVKDSLFNNCSNYKSSLSIVVTLYEHNYSGRKLILPPGGTPYLSRRMNNKVSSVNFFGFVGALVIYDKAFYKSRIMTIVSAEHTKFILPSWANDRMSSCMLF